MTTTCKKGVYEILGRAPVHPFPARMAPSLALEAMEGSPKPLRILDPMSGSGTVVAIAHSRGHRAIGTDLDPLAVLISKVWTTPVDVKLVRDMGRDVLESARQLSVEMKAEDACPKDADLETQEFIRFWFDEDARRQLTSLAMVIDRIEGTSVRNALWCAFSRLIITKRAGASLAMDVSHSRPHRKYRTAPVKPLDKFLFAVDRVAKNCVAENDAVNISPARIYNGDARSINLPNQSIDLVVTSPPYLNAIDYLRCSKFSLVWMGYSIGEIRRLRSTLVGTEKGIDAGGDEEIQSVLSDLELQPKLFGRQEAMLMRYIHDMRRVVTETSRVLTNRGKAIYVIGENTVRGTFIQNAKIMESVMNKAGLTCIQRWSRELPENRRYLPPPSKQAKSAALSSRMRREVVLTFQKDGEE